MDDYILFYPESDRFPDLTLRHCGYEECVPGHSYGPAVRSVYLIHIIIRGHGTFMANQQTFRLGEGDGFLIVPEMQTYYRADDKDPWTYCWVAFLGNRAEDVLRDIGLSRENPIFHGCRPARVQEIVSMMFQNREITRSNQYLNQSLLYRFFSVLLDDIEVRIGTHTSRNRIVG